MLTRNSLQESTDATSADSGDAIDILTQDHRTVDALLEEYESTKDDADDEEKESRVATLCLELTLHATVEEEIFYPAARDALDRDQASLLDEAEVEHASVRELITQLQRDRHECLSETAQTYLRDVHDHCVQIIDLIESYREIAGGLADTYESIMSNRTNDIVKVLTIIGTIFIPLTFLAGVYGMNMPIPETGSTLAYPAFWLTCLVVAGAMLLWFHRRGWL